MASLIKKGSQRTPPESVITIPIGTTAECTFLPSSWPDKTDGCRPISGHADGAGELPEVTTNTSPEEAPQPVHADGSDDEQHASPHAIQARETIVSSASAHQTAVPGRTTLAGADQAIHLLSQLHPRFPEDLAQITTAARSLAGAVEDARVRMWLESVSELAGLAIDVMCGNREGVTAARIVGLALCDIAPEDGGMAADQLNAVGRRMQDLVVGKLADYGFHVILPGSGDAFNPQEQLCNGTVEVGEVGLDGRVVSVVHAGLRVGSELDTPALVILGRYVAVKVA